MYQSVDRKEYFLGPLIARKSIKLVDIPNKLAYPKLFNFLVIMSEMLKFSLNLKIQDVRV